MVTCLNNAEQIGEGWDWFWFAAVPTAREAREARSVPKPADALEKPLVFELAACYLSSLRLEARS